MTKTPKKVKTVTILYSVTIVLGLVVYTIVGLVNA
jgi:hypothetical protein